MPVRSHPPLLSFPSGSVPHRWLLLLAAAALSLAPTPRTATLDSVDVQQIDRELIAARDGAPATRVRLEGRERVTWLRSRGTVGAALTQKRLLAVSLESAGWQEVRLLDGERVIVETVLGGNLLVTATQRRVLAFHGLTGVFSERRLAPGERVVEAAAGDRVGVVLTNRNAIGFAASRTAGRSERLAVREDPSALRVLATVATVRTPRRILTFDAELGQWREESRPPG